LSINFLILSLTRLELIKKMTKKKEKTSAFSQHARSV